MEEKILSKVDGMRENLHTLMERWLWQKLVSGKCMDTAWGQVCPRLHPKGHI